MPSADEATVRIELDLTPSEAAMLTAATCEYFHHMKAVESSEMYGALILNKNVLAARGVWTKVGALTGVV